MDIKIQPGKSLPTIDSTKDVAAQQRSESAGSVGAGETDPVTTIAMELIEGKIDTAEAVNRLIEQTLNLDLVAQAPASLRQEVEAVLRAAIDTDPYLVSLTRKLD